MNLSANSGNLADLANKGLGVFNPKLPDDKKLLLEKVKSRIHTKLVNPFMKEDHFVLRFLNASKFDAEKAELMLLNHLHFRKEHRMDGIQEEDWSDMEKDYPYRLDGFDKMGRPLLQIDFGKWDLSKASEIGKEARLFRYVAKMYDEATIKVRTLQSQGENVAQWVELANLDGVNSAQHANFQSSRFYFHLANTFENHEPGMGNHVILINTPEAFGPVMRLLHSIITEETAQIFKAYGEPKEWKPVLDTLIDPDQLPLEYGGTKK